MRKQAAIAIVSAILAFLLTSCGQTVQEQAEAFKTCKAAGMEAVTYAVDSIRCVPEAEYKIATDEEGFYRSKFACEDNGGKYVFQARMWQCDKK